MAQGSDAPENTGGVANVKTGAGHRAEAERPGSTEGGSGAGRKPQGSGDSPKPHGDPLKHVLEE